MACAGASASARVTAGLGGHWLKQPTNQTRPAPPRRRQVIDLSKAAVVMDMRPSRLSIMTGAAKAFIRAFFDQNPLSQLGVVVMRNGVAARLTELSGSPESQIAQLNASMATGARGAAAPVAAPGWRRAQGGGGGPGRRMLVVSGVPVLVSVEKRAPKA